MVQSTAETLNAEINADVNGTVQANTAIRQNNSEIWANYPFGIARVISVSESNISGLYGSTMNPDAIFNGSGITVSFFNSTNTGTVFWDQVYTQELTRTLSSEGLQVGIILIHVFLGFGISLTGCFFTLAP